MSEGSNIYSNSTQDCVFYGDHGAVKVLSLSYIAWLQLLILKRDCGIIKV